MSLCLGSTATRKIALPLWLHGTTHHGSVATPLGHPTSGPSLPSVAEPLPSKERCVQPRTFYRGLGFSARTPDVQLERYPVGELSLSAETECLSLPPDCSTDVQAKQAGGFPSADAVLSSGYAKRLRPTCWGHVSKASAV